MKLRLDQAETLDQLMQSEGWKLYEAILADRRETKINQLVAKRKGYEDLMELGASIRELDYLRAEPSRLIKESYKETQSGR